MSEVEDGPNTAEGEQRDVNNLYPLLMQHNGGRDSWNKGKNKSHADIHRQVSHTHGQHNDIFSCFSVFLGPKDSAQQDKFANMVRLIIYVSIHCLKKVITWHYILCNTIKIVEMTGIQRGR